MASDLPFGPELDALVAEVVRGWTIDTYPDDTPLMRFWFSADCEEMAEVSDELGDDGWSPSTDWRAAGEVIEKLSSQIDPYDVTVMVMPKLGHVDCEIAKPRWSGSCCETGQPDRTPSAWPRSRR